VSSVRSVAILEGIQPLIYDLDPHHLLTVGADKIVCERFCESALLFPFNCGVPGLIY